MKEQKVLIAGAGIGGLTAALCLAAKGHEVAVYEQAAELSATGAGIQLSPNCTRVLHHLGLKAALRACAFVPQGTQFRHWRNGRVITESPLGDSVVAQYGAPYYHIHRGDLLQVLVDAIAATPGIEMHTSARVEGFIQDAQQVQINLASGEQQQGDLLVGADGIHSVIRAGLWGAEHPEFTGNVAWRALVPTAKLPQGLVRPMSTVWWGPNKHFVHYYVRSGEFINCVCVVEKSGWTVESWTEPGEPAELKSDFAGWHDDIQRLIDEADRNTLFKWALFDRPPMQSWGQGRTTLLGDACHPTLPFMAQGAAMAIEDAAVLAECLALSDEPASALTHYEQLRRPRTAGIQNGSRRNAKVFHMAGLKAWMRNRAAHAARHRTMDELFKYNALEVAQRPVNPHQQSYNREQHRE